MNKLISLIKIIWNNPELIKKSENDDWWHQCFLRKNKELGKVEKERDEISQRLIDNNIENYQPYIDLLSDVQIDRDEIKRDNEQLRAMWEAEQEPIREYKDKYIKLLAAVKVLDINIDEKI